MSSENAAGPLALDPDFTDDAQARRAAGYCAPFADDAATVEPIWRHLADRAAMLGHTVPPPPTTDDPDLHVVCNGHVIAPLSVQAGCYRFLLPRDAATLRLRSRRAVPHQLQPWVEDSRQLGVMVRRLALWQQGRKLDLPMDHPDLRSGWWTVERDTQSLWRWTDGDALLALPYGEATLLEVTLGGTMAYPVACPVYVDRQAA